MLKNLFKVPRIDGHSNIEIQIANGCNLTCQSCSHYTNVGGGKNLSAAEVEDWIREWNEVLLPENFIIMGGEPTLNKDLLQITRISCELWKHSKVKIVTNGYFLKNHPRLPEIMHDMKVSLEISLKSDSDEYRKQMAPVRELVDSWTERYRIDVRWREDQKSWLKVYHGYGPNIKPFEDNDPAESYRNCGQKVCRALHERCIWKCPRLAYLHTYKFKLDDSWDKYLKYEPLRPGASLSQIRKFFTEEEIPECSMCPAKKHRMELPSPLIPARNILDAQN